MSPPAPSRWCRASGSNQQPFYEATSKGRAAFVRLLLGSLRPAASALTPSSNRLAQVRHLCEPGRCAQLPQQRPLQRLDGAAGDVAGCPDACGDTCGRLRARRPTKTAGGSPAALPRSIYQSVGVARRGLRAQPVGVGMGRISPGRRWAPISPRSRKLRFAGIGLSLAAPGSNNSPIFPVLPAGSVRLPLRRRMPD